MSNMSNMSNTSDMSNMCNMSNVSNTLAAMLYKLSIQAFTVATTDPGGPVTCAWGAPPPRRRSPG